MPLRYTTKQGEPRWRARWRTGSGERQSRSGFLSEREARAHEEAMRTARRRGQPLRRPKDSPADDRGLLAALVEPRGDRRQGPRDPVQLQRHLRVRTSAPDRHTSSCASSSTILSYSWTGAQRSRKISHSLHSSTPSVSCPRCSLQPRKKVSSLTTLLLLSHATGPPSSHAYDRSPATALRASCRRPHCLVSRPDLPAPSHALGYQG